LEPLPEAKMAIRVVVFIVERQLKEKFITEKGNFIGYQTSK